MSEPKRCIKSWDGTITWMGVTLTEEFCYRMRHEGLNPWLTVLLGKNVPLAKDDPRNPWREQK